jgi:hypothetical protein
MNAIKELDEKDYRYLTLMENQNSLNLKKSLFSFVSHLIRDQMKQPW